MRPASNPEHASIVRRSPVHLAVTALTLVLAFGCAPGTVGDGNGRRDGSSGIDGGNSSPDAGPPKREFCDNNIDDDEDDRVDEGCVCELGESQACWPFAPSRRGRGDCVDGTQPCVDMGEFGGSWGECTGAVDCDPPDECVPSEFGESCDDGVDQDCDGLFDCDDPDCECGCTPSGSEICDNGIDDDCDGDIDCPDSDCADARACCSYSELPTVALAIPDGDGVDYEAELNFDSFESGSTITAGSDIVRTCMVIEHSWLRDLNIAMECPSGRRINLSEFLGETGGEIFVGVPVEDDEGTGAAPTPGVGWEYCWDIDADRISMLPYANASASSFPTPGTLPAGDYQPTDSFDMLVGCPLNGTWRLIVTDDWARDNGYIFSWSIEFNAALECRAD